MKKIALALLIAIAIASAAPPTLASAEEPSFDKGVKSLLLIPLKKCPFVVSLSNHERVTT